MPGKSNSGEGGEDPARWENLTDVDGKGRSPTFPHLTGLQAGDVASSRIKQARTALSLLAGYVLGRSGHGLRMAIAVRPHKVGGRLHTWQPHAQEQRSTPDMPCMRVVPGGYFPRRPLVWLLCGVLGAPVLESHAVHAQVASGRFGVTPQFLVNAEQLEIKIAQGAKPGALPVSARYRLHVSPSNQLLLACQKRGPVCNRALQVAPCSLPPAPKVGVHAAVRKGNAGQLV